MFLTLTRRSFPVRIYFILASLVFPSFGSAATVIVACSGTITTALQSAVNSSASGDTIQIGAGTCSTGRISLTNKNITLKGMGKGVTNITADNSFAYVNVTGSNIPLFRLSGMTLTGTGNNIVIQVWATDTSTLRGPFRIDNIAFNYPTTHVDGLLAFWGPVYGLIDHNDFTDSGITIITGMEIGSETCSYNFAWQGGGCSLATLSGRAAAALPYEPGSARNLYIEDNTFTNTSSGGGMAIDTAYSGGRIVFRNNTLQNSSLYAHWTVGNAINSLWWEIYGNRFNWTLPNDGFSAAMRLHGGGTGLVYNNTVTGFPSNNIRIGDGRIPDQNQTGSPLLLCDGSHAWDGNFGDPAAPGWPCLAQVGRAAGKSLDQIMAGDKQTSFPLYLWNNGTQDKCSNSAAAGVACSNSFGVTIYNANQDFFKSAPHPNGDVDWSKTASKPSGAGTHTLTYTPFAYPYPLDANGLPNPTGNQTSTPHPADANSDFLMALNEATKYGACWKNPAAFGDCPAGIAIDYAVRAGTLWAGSANGQYQYNSANACPLCWEIKP